MSLAAILLEELTKTYGERRGVEALSLSVPEGCLFGFLGPNGAGKSTTIRVLTAMLRATRGRASLFGRECWRHGASLRREIGYLPGDVRLYEWMNGESALRWLSRVRGRDLRREGSKLAARLALDLRTRVRQMSRGTRQKLGIVLALAHHPRLLILDEPSAGLDPLMQAEFRAILRERAAAGVTVFFSSHTLGEVEQLCERIAIVREGRLVADTTLHELRRRSGHVVEITFCNPSDAAVPPPPFLRVTSCKGATWSGVLTGTPDDLTRYLAGRGIADLSIGRPDLETLFQSYYAGKSS